MLRLTRVWLLNLVACALMLSHELTRPTACAGNMSTNAASGITAEILWAFVIRVAVESSHFRAKIPPRVYASISVSGPSVASNSAQNFATQHDLAAVLNELCRSLLSLDENAQIIAPAEIDHKLIVSDVVAAVAAVSYHATPNDAAQRAQQAEIVLRSYEMGAPVTYEIWSCASNILIRCMERVMQKQQEEERSNTNAVASASLPSSSHKVNATVVEKDDSGEQPDDSKTGEKRTRSKKSQANWGLKSIVLVPTAAAEQGQEGSSSNNSQVADGKPGPSHNLLDMMKSCTGKFKIDDGKAKVVSCFVLFSRFRNKIAFNSVRAADNVPMPSKEQMLEIWKQVCDSFTPEDKTLFDQVHSLFTTQMVQRWDSMLDNKHWKTSHNRRSNTRRVSAPDVTADAHAAAEAMLAVAADKRASPEQDKADALPSPNVKTTVAAAAVLAAAPDKPRTSTSNKRKHECTNCVVGMKGWCTTPKKSRV